MVVKPNTWDKVFKSKRTKWLDPQRSVGQFHRIMGDMSCWEATGLAREAFTRIAMEIKQYLEKYSDPVSDEVTWTMYMIGRTKDTSEPTIMFCGRDAKCRKQVRKTVKESGILERHPGVRLGDASRPPDFDQLVQLGALYQKISWEDAASELFDLDESDLRLHSKSVVLGDEHGAPFGKKLAIPVYDGDQRLISVRVATGGGILRAGSRHFYLGAGHVFEEREKLAGSDEVDEIDDYSFDVSEEEQSDDDSQLFETTSRGSLSPDIDELMSSDGTTASTDIHSQSSISGKGPEERPIPLEEHSSISPPDSTRLERLLDGLVIVGRPLTRTINHADSEDHGGDLDYSLIELTRGFSASFNTSPITPAQSLPFSLSGSLMTKPANQAVLSITTSAGLIRGTISGTPTYQLIAGALNTRELWTVKFQSTLRDGDCGSWVVDENCGDLAGHIVAGSPETGAAYIIPAYAVFADAKSIYGLDLEPVLFPRTVQNQTAETQPNHSANKEATGPLPVIDIASAPYDSFAMLDGPASAHHSSSATSRSPSINLQQLAKDDPRSLSLSEPQSLLSLRTPSHSSSQSLDNATKASSLMPTPKHLERGLPLRGGIHPKQNVTIDLRETMRGAYEKLQDWDANDPRTASGKRVESMDSFSITAVCVGHMSTITKVSTQIDSLIRKFREAQENLDEVLRELSSLRTMLEMLWRDAESGRGFPGSSVKQISKILTDCGVVLEQIEILTQKYTALGKRAIASKSAIANWDDVNALRSRLKAHISALAIALDIVSLSLTPEIQVDHRIEKATPGKEDSAALTPSAYPKEGNKLPIKFKDAVGRKFSFPFHLCATWEGMEELIKQAFLHVDVMGPSVQVGHYDLIGPNGEIILPQAWETTIEPGWSVTMHMWPMPEPQLFPTSPQPMGQPSNWTGGYRPIPVALGVARSMAGTAVKAKKKKKK